MRILFIGTGEIGLPALRWLLQSGHEIAGIYTQPDKPAGRKQELLPSPIKLEALAHGIPVFQPVKIRAAEPVAQIAGMAADIIVVMAYGQILPRAILEAPRMACLNLHASLLPRHRGAAPIQAAIMSGDAESGVTVMYMDEGLDTGDVLLAECIPLAANETGGTLHDRLGEIAPLALEQALSMLQAGTAPRVKQDAGQASYAPKLEREHGLISWSLSAQEVGRQVRAMDPWPGAYTWLHGSDGALRKLKMFNPLPHASGGGKPGEVKPAEGSLLVGCGAGLLTVNEVQMEGKRRMSAGEFLRGHPLPPGTLLGPGA